MRRWTDPYVVRAADELIGALPDDLANLIITFRDEGVAADRAANMAREVDRREWYRHLAIARRAHLRETAAMYRLAVDFGERHGWRLSPTPFDLKTLSRGTAHSGGRGYGDRPWGDHSLFDHPYYYRLDRKAAAIAAHLYGYPSNKTACEAAAAAHGLQIDTPDFPSWWFPGATVLVVYRRAGAALVS